MINDEQLIVVGTGIRSVGQLTTEAIAWIRVADKVFYLVTDPVAEEAIRTLNRSGAESLMPLYGESRPRAEAHRAIVRTTMAALREGQRVCVATYGHPGVLATWPHEVVRRARAEGFKARMLPAVSAADCMFANLGIDQVGGCISFEATDFLLNARWVDPAAHLILWQVGGLGDPTHRSHGYSIRGLPQLAAKLAGLYGPQHPATLYEAPLFPGVEPSIRTGPVAQLPQVTPSPSSTLYVPPATRPPPDMAARYALGMG